jgi:hypothetical protein
MTAVAERFDLAPWLHDSRRDMTPPDPTSERLARLRRILSEWTSKASDLAQDDRELAAHWSDAVADLEQLIRRVERTEVHDLALI